MVNELLNKYQEVNAQVCNLENKYPTGYGLHISRKPADQADKQKYNHLLDLRRHLHQVLLFCYNTEV